MHEDAARQSISKYGHHVYVVSGAPTPRYAYTIGLLDKVGAELVLSGCLVYPYHEVVEILNAAATFMGRWQGERPPSFSHLLGHFELRQADPTWSKALLIGALDYHNLAELPAWQVLPDAAHWTADIPDMSQAWDAASEPSWRWLHEPWGYPAPQESTVVTNVAALRGSKITEVARWSDSEWEIFAGPGVDVVESDARVVPLGTLLSIDTTVEAALRLQVGEGLWRSEKETEWTSWSSGG